MHRRLTTLTYCCQPIPVYKLHHQYSSYLAVKSEIHPQRLRSPKNVISRYRFHCKGLRTVFCLLISLIEPKWVGSPVLHSIAFEDCFKHVHTSSMPAWFLLCPWERHRASTSSTASLSTSGSVFNSKSYDEIGE